MSNSGKNSRKERAAEKFEGGTSLQFHSHQNRVIAEFLANSCYDLVQIPEDFGEVQFLHERPCPVGQEEDYIQNLLGKQVELIEKAFDDSVEEINASELTDKGKESQILSLKLKKISDIRDASTKEHQERKDLASAISRWETKFEEFQKKVGDCVQIFYKFYGPGPLSVCEDLLVEKRVAAAWRALEEKYNAGAGGEQNLVTVMQTIEGFVVSRKKGSLEEDIKVLKNLFFEAQGGGINPPIVEAMQCEYLLRAVEKSGVPAFVKVVEDLRREKKKTLQSIEDRLREEEARMVMNEGAEKNRKGKSELKASEDVLQSLLTKVSALLVTHGHGHGKKKGKKPDEEVAVARPAKREQPTCGICQKRGHTSEDCWSKVECPKCKQKGHIEKFCPLITGKPLGTATPFKKPFKVGDYSVKK